MEERQERSSYTVTLYTLRDLGQTKKTYISIYIYMNTVSNTTILEHN